MFADKLRKSILQAAIQGKLSKQLPTDGDARQLLRDIQKERAKLTKAKKIKAAPARAANNARWNTFWNSWELVSGAARRYLRNVHR